MIGQKFGAIQIVAKVGEGGMGEVYRARDTRLHRDVAIKVLLPSVATDAERLARFRREAQVLASLNHPNIAHIHGLEDGDQGPLLVMEFVEGPTLADRIAQGAIAVDEAIGHARQIADALEAAHERGVIHRDLKPANIKITGDGAVKVLDFGLAKALDSGAGTGQPGAGAGTEANSPTITTPAMTQAGLILGTAAYMSPEQAKGRVVDKRSDVWAFGCVLFEMLTGRRAFEGEDVTDTIAAVVRGEPDWQALPPDTPPQVRLLLKRALDKDRRTRMSDISVARFLMSETIDPPATGKSGPAPAATARVSPRVAAAAVIGLLTGGALAVGAWLSLSSPPSRPAPARFSITPPASQPLVLQGNDHDLAIAPDGSFIVYRSGDAKSMQTHLAVRAMNDLEPRMLPGTTNARFPFISADGRWVGYSVGGELRSVSIAGGPPTVICRLGGVLRGASWGEDDFIVYGVADGLFRVPASGGDPKALTSSEAGKPEVHSLPYVLPGGKWAIFTAYPGTDFLSGRLEAVEIATGRRKLVLPAGHDAAYVEGGYLVYGLFRSADSQQRLQASLQAVRFDASRVEVIGEPVGVVEAVSLGGASSAVNYALSYRGHLAFVPAGSGDSGPVVRSLVWVDRNGREAPIPAPPRSYAVARISPDGSRVALDIRDQLNDIWVWDISRQTLSSLSRHAAQDMSPVWTADGRRIIWTSTRGGGNPNLYWQAADGTGQPERLTTNQTNQFPTSITSDSNRILLFGSSGNPGNAMDLFTVVLSDPGREATPLVSAPGFDFGPELSPDGRWLAYHSNESGEPQVYVRPFPNVQDGRWQISTNGGSRAVWSRNGRELFYLDGDGLLHAVAVAPSPGPTFTAGNPVKILSTKYYDGSSVLGLDLRSYDVSPDGQRFLMIKDPEPGSRTAPAPSSMVVVLNWSEELKARLPER